jgi:hypothetical protein
VSFWLRVGERCRPGDVFDVVFAAARRCDADAAVRRSSPDPVLRTRRWEDAVTSGCFSPKK